MTKEEAKAEIRKVFEPAFANYIITALTEGATPSERKSKWIPVAERLPENEGSYIVTVRSMFGGGYVTREWFDGNEWSYSYVVAWMPLPEPYKEGADNGTD